MSVRRPWTSAGEIGTTGKELRLEAFEIKLTGELASLYTVRYRAHVQNIGWQGWKTDGQTAGTVGQSHCVWRPLRSFWFPEDDSVPKCRALLAVTAVAITGCIAEDGGADGGSVASLTPEPESTVTSDSGGTASFAIITDFGNCDPGEKEVADMVAAWNPQIVATAGDNTQGTQDCAPFAQSVGDYYSMTSSPVLTVRRSFPFPATMTMRMRARVRPRISITSPIWVP